jgi:ferredoxin, 2Fe-2S
MVSITFRTEEDGDHVVQVAPGGSLMEAARSHGVPGILADCGGNCACGTCRVLVAEEWLARLIPPSDLELDTLNVDEGTPLAERHRLSCQIPVTSELNGLDVKVLPNLL